MEAQISICIATYRRPEALGRLLQSLTRLKLSPDLPVEVIVVDNDVDQSAASITQSYVAQLSGLRYCVEPDQNIARARNRAVAEARGRWLAFIDDDEAADENWLAAYRALFDAHECDGAFGPVVPQFETAGPGWLDAESFYSRPRQPSATPVARASTRTGNAMLRRTLFDGRAFDPAFGRMGGSDVELFGRMLDAGTRLLWCDDAIVTEYVPAERHNLRWLARRAFRGGFVFQTQHPSPHPIRAGLRSVALAAGLALGTPFAALGGRAPAARTALRSCTQMGRLWSLLGGRFEEYAG